MAQGRNDNLITVLDIGSSKICAMIVRNPEGSDLQVLGTGQRESKGIRRGYIADMEQTEAAIRAAVEQAERIAGINIDSAWVGFSAGGLVSKVTTIEADLGGYRIEDAHIRDLHIIRRCRRWTGLRGSKTRLAFTPISWAWTFMQC